jgi:cobalamin biosynthesis protein CobT
MYMNSTEQSSKMTQTGGEPTEERRADWIDLSGHESLTPPLTVVTELNEEVDDNSNEEESSSESSDGDNENHSESSEEECDDGEEDNEEEDEEEDNEDEDNEDDDEEEDNEDDEEHSRKIPGYWVCIVYDREYWNETRNKYMFTGMVLEENNRWMEVDCGEDEGVHVFHKCNSFLDFSRDTYTDRFGWTVRIHKVEYDYENCRIVDKTAKKNQEDSFQIPTKLEMPGVVAFGYILFISLVAPMFHALTKPNHYMIEEV